MGEIPLTLDPVAGPTVPPFDGREFSDRSLRSLTDVFRSLADRSRLMILLMLAERGEMSVSAIGEALDSSQPAVSHHLTQLRNAGFIDFRREGKFNYYKLDPNGFNDLVATMFPNGKAASLAFGALEVHFKKAMSSRDPVPM